MERWRIHEWMGAFHSMCNFLGTVGKIFKDAGLKDIVIDSTVDAEGWIEETNNSKDSQKQISTHNKFADLQKCLTEEQFQQLLKIKSCTRKVQLFNEYQNVLINNNVEITCFWMSYMYIDMVEILINQIRALKGGYWMLILAMIKAVIQWMFPYDRSNCAKYLSVCYNQMLNLPMEQLQVYEDLKNGGMVYSCGQQTHVFIHIFIQISMSFMKDNQRNKYATA